MKLTIAIWGLAFKPNIDDLRESPAKYIAQRILQDSNDDMCYIVEPNIQEHKVFKLTQFDEAVDEGRGRAIKDLGRSSHLLDAAMVEDGDAVEHQFVVVRFVARRAEQFGDAGALGEGDPDFRREDAFHVEGDDTLLHKCSE